jgi:hypothetical protein
MKSELIEFDPRMLDIFFYYLHERERIRIRRSKGLPGPWTDDPILRAYKFTNVLRIHDRTTQWLLKNWYQPNFEKPHKIQFINCAIARYFGTEEFCAALGYQDEWNPEYIMETARLRNNAGLKTFTSAYLITNGGIADKKWIVVVKHYLRTLWVYLDGLLEIAEETQSWQSVGERMYNFPGFGGTGFMTKEVLQDVMLTPILSNCVDRFEWTPVGPGARRGINLMLGKESSKKMNEKLGLAAIRSLHEICKVRMETWMPNPNTEFDLHCVQFALCEIAKYIKAQGGERLKNRFIPSKRPL